MKRIQFNIYVPRVCDTFGVDRDDLFNKTKKRNIVEARHMLYYLCETRPMRVANIQDYMGENGYGTGHSPIIHGIKMAKKKIEEDKDWIAALNRCRRGDVSNAL